MLLLDTILLRPYVFLFLLIYLIGCSAHLGFGTAILFAVAGYGIAWVSEFSSIHNGFPYGHYYYIEATKGREVWVLGVPFMDSLSYVFLAYASYSLALLIIAPVAKRGKYLQVLETEGHRTSLSTAFLGALLFVYLDIIIDPVALKGDRWFLGLIYGYPQGGDYYGVPLTNFAGWFVTGFVMIVLLQQIDRLLGKGRAERGERYPWRFLTGPLLYLGVVVFNFSVTFYIGEYQLGWTGVFLFLLPAVLLTIFMKAKVEKTTGTT